MPTVLPVAASAAAPQPVLRSLSETPRAAGEAPAEALRSGPRPDEPGPDRWAAYRLAFEWALDLAEVSRYFPPNEKRALAEPLREAARRLCVRLSAAWRQRHRAVAFAAALEEAADALAETRVWLDFAYHDRCITEEGWRELGLAGRAVERAFHQPLPQG